MFNYLIYIINRVSKFISSKLPFNFVKIFLK